MRFASLLIHAVVMVCVVVFFPAFGIICRQFPTLNLFSIFTADVNKIFSNILNVCISGCLLYRVFFDLSGCQFNASV